MIAADVLTAFREAMAARGVAPPAEIVADGELHRFATSPRASDDAGWYVLHADRTPAGAFGDWRTGQSVTWCAARGRRHMRPIWLPSSLLRSTTGDTRRTEAALALWRTGVEARGTVVERYLESRGITYPVPDTLRFHPRLRHTTGGAWPAMLALVTDGRDGTAMAVHRTFLARDGGGKALVHPCRMMLGPCRGGVVRLAPAGEVTLIGEGIETCLAAMQASGMPAWAALSTSGLRTLELPDEVRDVIILADGDMAGEAAAQIAALRWKQRGRRVRIARAPHGMDFNDLLLASVAAGKAGVP
jgi:phage/plasmid primase-like uncharacterized protein